ncbi:rod shape-determining protein MreC [Nocardioides silvaticus]|uniref:Cell shape-determining protein MreC n=1 Tax=Nocardioides silvaticus TaxID=2201891 RepID=A0A316TQC1_9ACTN|nr:rod shape-determining protein MreC [Nocardioides silvaticus]PWN04432.1 rod shape-determining protein MreC [Nocardioides silvaticus]
MSLDTRPPRQTPVRHVATPRERDEQRGLPTRSLLLALVLACITLMVVDRTSGEDSPVEPVRRVVGEVLGPAEAGVNAVLGPVLGLPEMLRTNDALREEIAAQDDEIAELRREAHQNPYDVARAEDLRALCAMATNTGYLLAPARFSGYSSAQSFSSTISIDAGADAGIRPDMTVVNGDGLVGRVLEVTSHTSTVLLIVDADSTVGGKLGESLESGFVDGRGGLADGDPLDLRLVDNTVLPEQGQQVVTWGSEGTGPYVAGIPIGEVSKVYEDIRAGTYRAVLEPYVDFTSLGDLAVVVPTGEDTRVIEPEACS